MSYLPHRDIRRFHLGKNPEFTKDLTGHSVEVRPTDQQRVKTRWRSDDTSYETYRVNRGPVSVPDDDSFRTFVHEGYKRHQNLNECQSSYQTMDNEVVSI